MRVAVHRAAVVHVRSVRWPVKWGDEEKGRLCLTQASHKMDFQEFMVYSLFVYHAVIDSQCALRK